MHLSLSSSASQILETLTLLLMERFTCSPIQIDLILELGGLVFLVIVVNMVVCLNGRNFATSELPRYWSLAVREGMLSSTDTEVARWPSADSQRPVS